MLNWIFKNLIRYQMTQKGLILRKTNKQTNQPTKEDYYMA